MVAKYEPLTALLDRQPANRYMIQMSFRRFEEVIGEPLPPGARRDRTWWGNTANRRRVQAHAWLNAGWRVEAVDFTRDQVTFVRGRS